MDKLSAQALFICVPLVGAGIIALFSVDPRHTWSWPITVNNPVITIIVGILLILAGVAYAYRLIKKP